MSPAKPTLIDAVKRAHHVDDPAIERHKDELFGRPAEPEQQYVQPGHCKVEWLGDSSPLGQAKIAAAIQLGLIEPELLNFYERLTLGQTTRIPRQTHHTMSRERDNMSQTYTWGPDNFIVEVTNHDAWVLLNGTFQCQFRIIGYTGYQPSDDDVITRFVEKIAGKELADTVRRIVINEGPAERLSGVINRGGMRLGSWT